MIISHRAEMARGTFRHFERWQRHHSAYSRRSEKSLPLAAGAANSFWPGRAGSDAVAGRRRDVSLRHDGWVGHAYDARHDGGSRQAKKEGLAAFLRSHLINRNVKYRSQSRGEVSDGFNRRTMDHTPALHTGTAETRRWPGSALETSPRCLEWHPLDTADRRPLAGYA